MLTVLMLQILILLSASFKNDSIKIVKSIGSLSDDQLEAGMTETEAIKKGIIIRDTLRVSALDTLFGKTYPIEKIKICSFHVKRNMNSKLEHRV